MSKHTPGEWFVELDPKNDHWIAGKTIGSMAGATYEGKPIAVRVADVCYLTPDETAFANARLIAAAPDYHRQTDLNIGGLLLLLKAIEEDDPKTELLARVYDLLRENKAVQAKAEGQTNGQA